MNIFSYLLYVYLLTKTLVSLFDMKFYMKYFEICFVFDTSNKEKKKTFL